MAETIEALDAAGIAARLQSSNNFARARIEDGTIPTEITINGRRPAVTIETFTRIMPELRRLLERKR